MKDEAFIESVLLKGEAAEEKASLAFCNMSAEQLNWKPSNEKWSIAQCLEHLIIADSCYFPDLKAITEETYEMNFWERYSPFSGVCGRLLKDRLQEEVGKKIVAPAIIRPSASNIQPDIVDRYLKNLDTFLQYISNCKSVDLDRVVITSPIIRIVTYSVRDALHFLIRHEHRHINQAIAVMSEKYFPGKKHLTG